MFCEKCGAKNEEGAIFCENCGSAINGENPPASSATAENAQTYYVPPTEKKPMSLKNKIITAAVIAVVALCTVFYFVGKVASDPKNLVKNYIESISAGNYSQTYDYMDIEETPFTTREMFVKVMEKEEYKIANYEIEEDMDSTPLKKRYVVYYTKQGLGYEDSMTVTLAKQKAKSWLLFDSYKVAAENLVTTDFSVSTYKGTTVTIDGVTLGEENVTSTDDTNTYYNIDVMFNGIYDIVISAPFIQEYTDTFETYQGSYYVSDLYITSEAQAALYSSTSALLANLCNAAKEGKTYEDIKGYFAEDTGYRNKDEYEELCERIKGSDGRGLKSINFSDFRVRNESTYFDGTYEVGAEYRYSYVYTYKDYFENTFKDYVSPNPSDGSAWVDYVYENGEWKVSSFDISLYFYY